MIKSQQEPNEEVINVGEASLNDVRESHSRLFVVMAVFAIAFVVLSARVIEVSVLSDGKHFKGYVEQEYSDEAVKARADILDRNGTLLAVNLATASLYANPKIIMNVDEAAKGIAGIFPDLDLETIEKRLSSDKSFVWIKRNLTPEEQYKVNELGFPGLFFKEEEKRIYPHKNLMSHVLGIVDVDGRGISGIEKQFNTYLSGTNDIGSVNEPLTLSVDVRAQSVVRDALQEAMEEFKALGATGIIMDVKTGEVISMVSLPDYNLNDPGDASEEARFNRATYGRYEMGSTFKTFNMALGFELGNVGMDDIYDVSEPLKVANFTIRDYHQKKKLMTAAEVYINSSNIASAQIALDIGEESQRMFLERLGLLDEMEIEIPERRMPSYPKQWGKARSMTISYGHGIAVTPMHIVKATAALVNGGVLYPATLLKKDKYSFLNDGTRVVSEITSDKVRKIMMLAVKYGTGSKANVAGYLVGGKTGTASKPKNGKYDKDANVSSFVAAFPMNKPKYIVLVMLDEPIGNKRTGGYTTAGMVAAPIVANIVERVAPILGVMPVDENDYEIRKEFWYKNAEAEQKVALAGNH